MLILCRILVEHRNLNGDCLLALIDYVFSNEDLPFLGIARRHSTTMLTLSSRMQLCRTVAFMAEYFPAKTDDSSQAERKCSPDVIAAPDRESSRKTVTIELFADE